MTAERFRHLGGGAFVDTVGGGPEEAFIEGRRRRRFMDELYLPSETDVLSGDALLAVNRWRERKLATAPLPHRERVRRVAIAAVRTVARPRLLEIGCGSFPLAPEVDHAGYMGLEVDPVAVERAREMGVLVVLDPAEASGEAERVDLTVSLFAMQFAVCDATLDLLRLMPPTAVLVMNVLTPRADLVSRRLDQLAERGLDVWSLDLSSQGVNDRLVAAGRGKGGLLEAVKATMLAQAVTEWPTLSADSVWRSHGASIAPR